MTFHQGQSTIPGAAEAGDLFGAALATGELLQGDGPEAATDDLVIGVPGEGIGALDNAGIVQMIEGSVDGLDPASTRTFHQNTPGVNGAAEAGDEFGATLLAELFNDDHRPELLIGAPGEGVGSNDDAGIVHVLFNSSEGTTTDGDLILRQGAAPFTGAPEEGDRFGSSLAGGFVQAHDQRATIAIGVPGEDIGSIVDAGMVQVLDIANEGLNIHQALEGVDGQPDEGDRFGEAVAFGPTWTGSDPSLYIGVPGETDEGIDGSGEVVIVPGWSGELDPASSWPVRPHQSGISPDGQPEAGFGTAIGFHYGTVLIGAPGVVVDGEAGAGGLAIYAFLTV